MRKRGGEAGVEILGKGEGHEGERRVKEREKEGVSAN